MAPKPKDSNNSSEEKEESFTKNVSDKSKIIKRKKKENYSYSLYVHKLLKQIHPDIGISTKAVNTIDSFVNDILDQIASEASKLAQQNKKATINSKDIQAAMKLILPGELAKHAESEGCKAVTQFFDSKK